MMFSNSSRDDSVVGLVCTSERIGSRSARRSLISSVIDAPGRTSRSSSAKDARGLASSGSGPASA